VSKRERNGHRARSGTLRDPQTAESIDPESPLSHVDVPPCVSAALRRYLDRIDGWRGKPATEELYQRRLAIAKRLGTDPKMHRVWQTLARHGGGTNDTALDKFVEAACATDVWELTVEDRAKMINYARQVADDCRSLAFARRWCNDEKLATAYSLVAEDFEKSAREEESMSPNSFVKNRIRDHGVRAYVRMLGRVTRRLFGATLYRTVATTATVSLGRPIRWQQVRNWCTL
jgi:hypothetical protein